MTTATLILNSVSIDFLPSATSRVLRVTELVVKSGPMQLVYRVYISSLVIHMSYIIRKLLEWSYCAPVQLVKSYCGFDIITPLVLKINASLCKPMVYHPGNLFSKSPCHHMMTSSNGNIFRVTGPLWRESTGYWWIPLTKAGHAEMWCFIYLHLEKRLSKQSRG